MLYLRVLFGALLSWPGVESVGSRVSIYKAPYTLVLGGNRFYCCEKF